MGRGAGSIPDLRGIFTCVWDQCQPSNLGSYWFCDLGETCLPRYPRFACSNPAEVDGFFQDVEFLSTSPPGGTLSRGSLVGVSRLVKKPQSWKIGLWAKYNRHIHILVIPKFGGAQQILKKIAVHWAAMTHPPILHSKSLKVPTYTILPLELESIYLYFPPSSQLVYLCFCPVGLSLL